jgi:hypothetical protein
VTPSADYPRMLFHRSGEWRIVQSRDEEEELGGEWSRTIIPPPDPLAGEVQQPSPYDPPPPKRSHKKKVDPCPPPQT